MAYYLRLARSIGLEKPPTGIKTITDAEYYLKAEWAERDGPRWFVSYDDGHKIATKAESLLLNAAESNIQKEALEGEQGETA